MSKNAFTQAEAALVDAIIVVIESCNNESTYAIAETLDKIDEMAEMGVTEYANMADWEAATQAVIQLVKERLNAIP